MICRMVFDTKNTRPQTYVVEHVSAQPHEINSNTVVCKSCLLHNDINKGKQL